MTDQSRHLTELTVEECWQLVATHPIGRLAWAGRSGVTVVPVNFTVEGQTVHLRTASYSGIARETNGQSVAFEVDSLDQDAHTGWSVLMRGRASLIHDLPAHADNPEPWSSERRPLLVEIDVAEITGRRLGGH